MDVLEPLGYFGLGLAAGAGLVTLDVLFTCGVIVGACSGVLHSWWREGRRERTYAGAVASEIHVSHDRCGEEGSDPPLRVQPRKRLG